jgi:diguanylate cyclase (GGDEF)-like protein/PAS domain S-box-containing protein
MPRGQMSDRAAGRFADLLFSPANALAVTDDAGAFTSISPTSMPLLGYAPEELIGRPMTGLIHRDDRTIAGTARRRMARTGEIENVSLRFRRKDGTYAWLECRSRLVINATTGVVDQTQLALHDIGDRVEAQHEMERNALTDTVTGLANRTLLIDRLNQALKRLKRNAGLVGVLMLDLDHFKVINDTLGHHAGDAVLISTAQRLLSIARPDDTIARFGGDEFVVVQSLATFADLSACADRIVTALREPHPDPPAGPASRLHQGRSQLCEAHRRRVPQPRHRRCDHRPRPCARPHGGGRGHRDASSAPPASRLRVRSGAGTPLCPFPHRVRPRRLPRERGRFSPRGWRGAPMGLAIKPRSRIGTGGRRSGVRRPRDGTPPELQNHASSRTGDLTGRAPADASLTPGGTESRHRPAPERPEASRERSE